MSAQDEFTSIFAAVRAAFDTPEIKAYYAAQAKQKAAEQRREEAAAQAKRDAMAAEERRSKSYDIWATNGGSDECTQFGINDGCKPWCPVFERGQCAMQAENEEIFASEGNAA